MSELVFEVTQEEDGGFHGWLMVDEWEVPDPYDACIKCKSAFDAAWP